MTNIAQEVIVQQNHLHRSLLFHDGTQFLQVHLQAAVSHEYAYRAVRTSKSGTDSCRKAEAHSTQATGSNNATFLAVFEITGGHHLILADISHQYRPVMGSLTHSTHHLTHA